MFLLGEIVVETAMIIATVTAAAIFVWATGAMLVRWFRFTRSERLATGDPAPTRVRAAGNHSHIAGPSL
jgi:hypothetical protein